MKTQPAQHNFAMKLRIKNGQDHKVVQEHLFKMGYRWTFGKYEAVKQDVGHLYANDDKQLYWTRADEGGEEFFKFQNAPEFEVEFVTNMNLKPARKRVEVLGKLYYEDELEKCLKNLQEAE